MTQILSRAVLCAALLTLAGFGATGVAAESSDQDWPQFRGVHRDGTSPVKGLVSPWPEKGPKEVWRVPIGEGYSGISVVGDRIYTMDSGDHEGKPTEFAVAFDATNGKEIWRVPMGEKHDTQFGNGPRSTPTVDGDTVFVLDSRGNFAALATKDGAKRWGLNLTEKYGTQMPFWGFSTSPLVDGDQVIFEAGGAEGKNYVALDKKTGEEEWTVGDGNPGYNSAIRITEGGKHRYVYVAGGKLMCVDSEGNELWTHDWPQGETHASPVYVPPNRIFASGAEGVGAALIEVVASGEAPSVKEVWKSRFMRNHFSTSIYHDGHIYGYDNATLKCISAADGELAWAKRGLGKGSMIFADGHLILLTDQGDLRLLEATPEAYRERGKVQALEGRCWTAPTLAGGRLYLRNHTEMVSYRVKG